MKKLLIIFALAMHALGCATFSVPSDFLTGTASSSTPSHKLGSTLIPQQAGDFWVNPTAASPFAIKDGSAVTRDTFETAHGRIQIGKGGTDFYAVIGPTSGAETTDASLYFGANGDTQNNSTFAVGYGTACQNLATHAGSMCFNARGSGAVYGDILFTNANGNPATLEMLGKFDGVSGQFNPVFGLGVGSAGNGTIISSSTSTPSVLSGSAATSFTVGGNAAGTVLNLSANANTTYMSFGGSTGQGEILAAASPSIATSGNTTLTAAQAANPIIKLGTVSLAADVTVTFPNAQGFWVVDASGITLNAHLLKFISGSTTSAAVTPSTTAQLFFVSTYGANTISIK
jgi:hypothetical protein